MVLNIQNADISDVIEALRGNSEAGPSISVNEDRYLILQQQLIALDGFLKKVEPSWTQKSTLKELRILPCLKPNTVGTQQELFLTATTDRDFWIADISFLKSKFENVAPLINCTGGKESLPVLQNLFDVLGLLNRRLTACVKSEEVLWQSHPVKDSELTNWFHDKVPFLRG